MEIIESVKLKLSDDRIIELTKDEVPKVYEALKRLLGIEDSPVTIIKEKEFIPYPALPYEWRRDVPWYQLPQVWCSTTSDSSYVDGILTVNLIQ